MEQNPSGVGGGTAVLDASPGKVTDSAFSNIHLDSPISRGDQVIRILQLRKPNAGELRGIKLADLLQMDVGALSVLLPRISNPAMTAADVAKLDPADLVSIASEVGGFFLSKAQRESLSA